MRISFCAVLLLAGFSISSQKETSSCKTYGDACPREGFLDWKISSESELQARSKSYCKKDPYHVFRYRFRFYSRTKISFLNIFSLLTFLTSLVVLVVTIVINNNLNNNNNNNNNNK